MNVYVMGIIQCIVQEHNSYYWCECWYDMYMIELNIDGLSDNPIRMIQVLNIAGIII